MGEDTSLLQRGKAFAAQPHVTRTALATSGTGTATLLLVYQLFASKQEVSDLKWEATKRASVQWQAIQTLDNELDAVKVELARLQGQLKTNTP